MLPKTLEKLIYEFKKLPGVGIKTATRYALYIAKNYKEKDYDKLSNLFSLLPKSIKKCENCNLLTEDNLCDICKNNLRDKKQIMVIESEEEAYLLEETKTYKGTYYVLGGLIDFSKGITEKDLPFEKLFKKATEANEIILATNSTLEGELTAEFIKTTLEKVENLKITRLAYGIPAKSDLKYTDSQTLLKAIENRRNLK